MDSFVGLKFHLTCFVTNHVTIYHFVTNQLFILIVLSSFSCLIFFSHWYKELMIINTNFQHRWEQNHGLKATAAKTATSTNRWSTMVKTQCSCRSINSCIISGWSFRSCSWKILLRLCFEGTRRRPSIWGLPTVLKCDMVIKVGWIWNWISLSPLWALTELIPLRHINLLNFKKYIILSFMLYHICILITMPY